MPSWKPWSSSWLSWWLMCQRGYLLQLLWVNSTHVNFSYHCCMLSCLHCVYHLDCVNAHFWMMPAMHRHRLCISEYMHNGCGWLCSSYDASGSVLTCQLVPACVSLWTGVSVSDCQTTCQKELCCEEPGGCGDIGFVCLNTRHILFLTVLLSSGTMWWTLFSIKLLQHACMYSVHV